MFSHLRIHWLVWARKCRNTILGKLSCTGTLERHLATVTAGQKYISCDRETLKKNTEL